MNLQDTGFLLVLAGLTASSAGAQTVTVTDRGLAAPVSFETGQFSMDNRFGFDEQEEFGQVFTLGQSVTLGSVWIAYNAFVDRSGTFEISVDAGDDGTDEIVVVNIPLDGVNFSGATTDGNTGPFYWMEWDLAAFGLTLPAGQSSFTIRCTAEGPPGAAAWVFAPCYKLGGDVYPAGQATGVPGAVGNDLGFAIDSGALGTTYCSPGVTNTSGAPGEISAAGSLGAANNDVTLSATSLPQNAFGYFLTSTTQGLVTNPGGSAGNLCLGGSVGRYVGPGQIQNSGSTGAISLAIDLTQMPSPTGSVAVQPGDTWSFTAWHRDMGAMGAATSNFTNGLEVTFN